MDPASITKKVVHEAALDGIYGMGEDRLWAMLANWLPQPLDAALKRAIWAWISACPEIRVEAGAGPGGRPTLFASADSQWLHLTGALPLDNPIGDKVFEVLSLIAHHRWEGVSTVQISKSTGQDPRLLFARVQTLVNHGLVQRFPVIENGSATNKMIFHLFTSPGTPGPGPGAGDPLSIDKLALHRLITEFCASGPQRLRLTRAIVELASQHWPDVKKPRLRRIVAHAISELEQLRSVLRVAVEDPERPGSRYNCVEYLKDPPAHTSSPSLSGVVANDGVIAAVDADEEDEDEPEDAGGADDLDVLKSEFDRVVLGRSSSPAGSSDAVNSDSGPRANLVFPLVNQIYDMVRESGRHGTSAMELNQRLTGPKYRRTLAKYLEILTVSNPKGVVRIPELEHLSLVKGVDFNRRVKFYRYFTRMAYSSNEQAAHNEQWGAFPTTPRPESVPSLLEIEAKLLSPLRLNCMIVKTRDGTLKPVFRGDMSLGPDVEVVLKSDPGPVNAAQPAKKRGRPRKHPLPDSKPTPPAPEKNEQTQLSKFKQDVELYTVPLRDRIWSGGSQPGAPEASVYLSLPGKAQGNGTAGNPVEMVDQDKVNHAGGQPEGGKVDGGKHIEAKQANGKPFHGKLTDAKRTGAKPPKGKHDNHAGGTPGEKGNHGELGESSTHDAPAGLRDRSGSGSQSMKSESEAPGAESQVASLAMQQRVDTFFSILQRHNGVLQGGTWLITKFSEAWQAKSTVDRRTITRMVNKLISSGHIRQISVSVPSSAGKISLKSIFYDPKAVVNPDTDERIQAMKAQIIGGNKESHSMAMRVAADLAKANMPVKQMTQEQLDVLRPPPRALPGRIMTAGGSGGRISTKAKMKYGPGAAEVLGVGKDGQPHSKAKRSKKDEVRGLANSSASDVHTQQMQKLQQTLGQLRGIVPPQRPAAPPGYSDVMEVDGAGSPPIVDLDTLARRVIVYKALTPRRGAAIDWKVVVAGLPGLSPGEAQKLWPDARKHLSEVNSMQSAGSVPSADIVMSKIEAFENLFVQAYRRGEVEYPQMDDLKTTVVRLSEWWTDAEIKETERLLALEEAARADRSVRVAQITGRLKALQLKPKGEPANPDPLAALQSSGSVVNSEKLLNDTPFSFSVPGDARPLEPSSRFSDAELRVRAVIAADIGPQFSPALATQELTGLSDDQVNAARSGLEQKRVIQWADSDPGKTPTGRPYVLHDLVLSALSIPKTSSGVFAQAAQNIEGLLAQKSPSFQVLPTIEEAQMIAALEILTMYPQSAHVKREGENFGLISADYKSRDIDKQAFECDLEFKLNNSEPQSQPFGFIDSPRSKNEHRPFLWQTQFLTSHQVWSKVVAKLFSVILFRPGIRLEHVALSVKAALEPDETRSAVDAMIKGRILESRDDGLFVTRQWYLSMKST